MIAITELGRVYATATDKNQLAISDANSLAVIATADGGDYPDGLTYDPEVGKIYVSHEHGGADTVVDTGPTRQSPESSVGDDVGNTYRCSPHPGGGRVKNHFVSIDPATDQVAGTTDLSGCPGAHGLAIDADRGLAFVACEGNAKFLALDLRNMQIVFTGDVGKTPDVMDLDRPQQHVYVAAESGPLTVFDYSGETVRQPLQADAGPKAANRLEWRAHHLRVLDALEQSEGVLLELERRRQITLQAGQVSNAVERPGVDGHTRWCGGAQREAQQQGF